MEKITKNRRREWDTGFWFSKIVLSIRNSITTYFFYQSFLLKMNEGCSFILQNALKGIASKYYTARKIQHLELNGTVAPLTHYVGTTFTRLFFFLYSRAPVMQSVLCFNHLESETWFWLWNNCFECKKSCFNHFRKCFNLET